jgi:hypothetical protein
MAITPDPAPKSKVPLDPSAAAILAKKVDLHALEAMLEEWRDEDARDPTAAESWEEFRRAMNANRGSERKLYP